VDLNWVVGDFFLQFYGIWYTLAQVRVRVPVWRYICVRLDTRAETATAVMDGQVRREIIIVRGQSYVSRLPKY
jgi:hypothetical protein